jgi:hypothetical protein
MSKRYPGGIIRKTPQTPSQTSAQGIWDMASVTQAVKENTWPIAGVPDPISKSLRFRSSASARLTRTPSVAGNKQIFTVSFWLKTAKSNFDYYLFEASTDGGNNERTVLAFNAGKLQFRHIDGGSAVLNLETTQVFRDPSAWYHIVLAVDTTQATSSNRVKMYLNGSQITAFGTASYPTQNLNTDWNGANAHSIGSSTFPDSYADMYLTEFYNIDGQALTPSSFGSTNDQTGVWQPIAYTGTYGTNGFYLPFSNTSSTTTLGNDFSGNSNNWTTNNISLTSGSTYDSMNDVPTQWIPYNTAGDTGALWRGNYCVLNPLDAQGTATLTNGNLTLASSSTTHRNRKATFVIPSTGKWYWELTTASTSSSSVILGWGLQTTAAATDSQAGNANTWMAQNDANQDIWNQTTNVLSTGSAVAGGSIRQVAYDADSGKLWFGVNNTWYSSTDLTSGNPSAGTNQCMTLSAGSYFPTISCYNLTANANFGQQPFSYTPPTGFKTLCTTNLTTPTIGATASTTANEYMDATLYTGNGGSLTVTNSGSMQPDFVWVKSRSTGSTNHLLEDVIRGTKNSLISNGANTELARGINAFLSNGFSFNDDAGGDGNVNGQTYVGWQWKANGTGVSNTAGSITSTVSANTTAGFSIVTWVHSSTTSTIGHGLGVAPTFIILKSRTTAYNWDVGCTSIGWGNRLNLNTTDAAYSPAFWNSTAPTSTVFTYAGSGATNGDNMVAYCFTPIAGYSAFGSYTGNGSSDGPFIFTGFRPRYVLIKRTDSANDWLIIDTSRNPYNVTNLNLWANLSSAEGTANRTDVLSNGFKLRNNLAEHNASGGTYIYMAFAESPFKYALAR